MRRLILLTSFVIFLLLFTSVYAIESTSPEYTIDIQELKFLDEEDLSVTSTLNAREEAQFQKNGFVMKTGRPFSFSVRPLNLEFGPLEEGQTKTADANIQIKPPSQMGYIVLAYQQKPFSNPSGDSILPLSYVIGKDIFKPFAQGLKQISPLLFHAPLTDNDDEEIPLKLKLKAPLAIGENTFETNISLILMPVF